MTVAELIARLQALPPEAEVVIPYYEADWHPVSRAEKRRAYDQPKRPYQGAVWIPGPDVLDDEDEREYARSRGSSPRPPVVALHYGEHLPRPETLMP